MAIPINPLVDLAAKGDWDALRTQLGENHSLEFVSTPGKADKLPLHIALENGAPFDVVQLLVAKGKLDGVNAVDASGNTPLHYAARYQVAAIVLLLDKGANVNALNKNKQSPLHCASQNAAPIEVFQALLQRGADVNAQDEDGQTPLIDACGNYCPLEVVRLLVEHGADVNIRSKNDWTALHLSCWLRVPCDIVSFLIEHGADVNALTTTECTPMHYACANGVPLNLIKLLLDSGANPTLKNNKGETPIDIEVRPEIQNLIQDRISSSNVPTPTIVASPQPPAGAATDEEQLPFFFVELFAKAKITDSKKRQVYAAKLQEMGLDSAAKITLVSAEGLKNLNISAQDAADLEQVSKDMVKGIAEASIV